MVKQLKPNSVESPREWVWQSPTPEQGHESFPVMSFAQVHCAAQMPMRVTISCLLLRTACRMWFLSSPMFQDDRLAEVRVSEEVH